MEFRNGMCQKKRSGWLQTQHHAGAEMLEFKKGLNIIKTWSS